MKNIYIITLATSLLLFCVFIPHKEYFVESTCTEIQIPDPSSGIAAPNCPEDSTWSTTSIRDIDGKKISFAKCCRPQREQVCVNSTCIDENRFRQLADT